MWPFRKKPAWEDIYARNVYEALVTSGGPGGEMTPEQLHISEMQAPQYHRKALVEREILCFAAVMETTDKDAVPHLLPLIGVFGRIVLTKQQSRTGLQLDLDVLAEKANLNAHELRTNPLGKH